MARTEELQTDVDGGGNIGVVDGRNWGGEDDDIERLLREAEAHANGTLLGGLVLRSVNSGLGAEWQPGGVPHSSIDIGRISVQKYMPPIYRSQ